MSAAVRIAMEVGTVACPNATVEVTAVESPPCPFAAVRRALAELDANEIHQLAVYLVADMGPITLDNGEAPEYAAERLSQFASNGIE